MSIDTRSCFHTALLLGIAACGPGEPPAPAAGTANEGLGGDSSTSANDMNPQPVGSNVVEPSAGGAGGAGGSGQLQWRAAGTTGACTPPSGARVEASDYYIWPSGCGFYPSFRAGDAGTFPVGVEKSFTIEDEATFRDVFACSDGAVSGIDFTTHRLRVSDVANGSAAPGQLGGAVVIDGVLHLWFRPSSYCSASFPPSSLFRTLIPKSPEAVVEDVCVTVCAWLPPP